MKETIVLLHGFFRTKRDMNFLANEFKKQGYTVNNETYPLFFNEIDRAVTQLVNVLKSIDRDVILIGHSTGGLVILQALKQYNISFKKAIFISSPIKGSYLATEITKKTFLMSKVFRTIKSLSKEKIDNNFYNVNQTIGLIIGKKSNTLLNKLLGGDNDYRVKVDNCLVRTYPYLILPETHKKIHHKKRTFNYIMNFIEHDQFIL